MTDDLQLGHLSKMQSLSLGSQLNFSTMLWGFVRKLRNSFFLRLFSPFTSKQQFSHILHKQDVHGMLLLNEYCV